MSAAPVLTRTLVLMGVLAAGLPLGGCGFRPLYGEENDVAVDKLPDIFVDSISDRSGQELRLALQQRLAGSSDTSPEGYRLSVGFSQSSEAVDIHGDNTSGRNRVVGRAHWVLYGVSPAPIQLASGDARTVDGYNVINAQYFAASIAANTTQQREADNLADAITEQVAIWFTNHKPPASTPERPKPTFLVPGNVPGNSDELPQETPGDDGLPASAIGRSSPTP